MAEVIIVAAKEAVRGSTKKSNQVFIGGGGVEGWVTSAEDFHPADRHSCPVTNKVTACM